MDEIIQGTDEWFMQRCGCASASRFKDILAKGKGVTRDKYLIQLVKERLTKKPLRDTFVSASMLRGVELEADARIQYELATGAFVDQVSFIRLGEKMVGASPDGLVGLSGGAEFKCLEDIAHTKFLRSGQCLPEYVPQVQGGMWVTEREWWDFVSYNPEFPEWLQLKIIRVQRDDEYIKMLESEVDKFLSEVDAEVWNLDLLKKESK
jgi:hypothetical protein